MYPVDSLRRCYNKVAISLCLSLLISSSVNAEYKSVTIGGLPNMDIAPYLWLDCSGTYKGFLPHLVKKALAKESYTLSFQSPGKADEVSWAKSIKDIQNGQYDLSITMFKPSPEGVVVGAEPILYQVTALVSRKNEVVDFDEPDTLINKKGIVMDAKRHGAGSVLLKQLKDKKVDVGSGDDARDALNSLAAGSADFVVGDYYYLLEMAKTSTNAYPFDFAKQGEGKGIYLGVQEGGPYADLPHTLDKYFKQYRDDGLLKKLRLGFLQNWRAKGCSET